MITVHHLNDSRSQRILWLLEELGLPYDIVRYQRDAQTRLAPPALKAVHPLGKSPVITDDHGTVAESGAIVDHIIRRHGGGRMQPDAGSADYDSYVEWLHFAEGSAMLPFMLQLYAGLLGEGGAPLQPRIASELANHLDYIEQALDGRDWLMGGSEPSGADVMLSFVGEIAVARADVSRLPNIVAWVSRFQARPAYRRALEKGGPYALARS